MIRIKCVGVPRRDHPGRERGHSVQIRAYWGLQYFFPFERLSWFAAAILRPPLNFCTSKLVGLRSAASVDIHNVGPEPGAYLTLYFITTNFTFATPFYSAGSSYLRQPVSCVPSEAGRLLSGSLATSPSPAASLRPVSGSWSGPACSTSWKIGVL